MTRHSGRKLRPGRRPGQRGRSCALTGAQVAEALAAKARGVSDEEQGRRYGCSARTIVRSLARAARAAKAGQMTTGQTHGVVATGGAAGDGAPTAADSEPGDVAAMTRDEQRRHWSDVLRRSVARSAVLEGNAELEAAARWHRIGLQAGAALLKLGTGEAAVDANALPDMVEAADRGRAKLADYLERIRLGKCPGRGRARPSDGATSS